MVAQPKTYVAKPQSVPQKWYVVDATDCILGRLASDVAMVLMGKHRPEYTPHVDTGEFVVVINAEKVVMTGNKLQVRHYAWYNGYHRQKMESYAERLERKPTIWSNSRLSECCQRTLSGVTCWTSSKCTLVQSILTKHKIRSQHRLESTLANRQLSQIIRTTLLKKHFRVIQWSQSKKIK